MGSRMGAYFRLICSHLHELALHIRAGSKNQAVAQFLATLNGEATAATAAIAAVEADLSPARQSTFHYPKVGSQALAGALREVADQPAVIGGSDAPRTVRFLFADQVANALAFGRVEDDDAALRRLVERTAEAVTALARLSKAALHEHRQQRGLMIVGDGDAPPLAL